jgi:hypothetical protein
MKTVLPDETWITIALEADLTSIQALSQASPMTRDNVE